VKQDPLGNEMDFPLFA